MTELPSLIADLASGDDVRAERARAAVARHGPAALPALLRLLQSAAPDHRWWAIRCLADQFDELADRALVDALLDPDVSVQQVAALTLRDRPLSPAIPQLVRLLGSGDGLLSRLAGDALAGMGSAATRDLSEAIRSPLPAARIAAARSLALNLDPGAVPALYSALDDPSCLVEYWTIEGLERRGLGMVYFSP